MRRFRLPPARREESLPLDRVLPGEPGLILVKRSSARRSLALRITEAGQVVVNAPLALPARDLDAFLGKHAGWLAQHLASTRARAGSFVWQDGALLPWLGGHLTLALATPGGRSTPHRQGDVLHCAGEAVAIPALVIHWYRQQARPLLAERLARQSALAGRPTPPLRLSDARSRWGSLSPRGVVSLNWRLVKAREELIDYVICHELAHFRQRNHSAAFWREVETLFPDWRNARQNLRESGQTLFLF